MLGNERNSIITCTDTIIEIVKFAPAYIGSLPSSHRIGAASWLNELANITASWDSRFIKKLESYHAIIKRRDSDNKLIGALDEILFAKREIGDAGGQTDECIRRKLKIFVERFHDYFHCGCTKNQNHYNFLDQLVKNRIGAGGSDIQSVAFFIDNLVFPSPFESKSFCKESYILWCQLGDFDKIKSKWIIDWHFRNPVSVRNRITDFRVRANNNRINLSNMLKFDIVTNRFLSIDMQRTEGEFS